MSGHVENSEILRFKDLTLSHISFVNQYAVEKQ